MPEVAQASLLDEIRKVGYEAAVITTYNINFDFFEEVVLRRLVAAGVHHVILLMDAGMLSQAVQESPPQLAGRHYTLVPMSMSGAFHPKMLMLLGKSKGFLAVGSHNLTLSGFGLNREVTNVFRANHDPSDEAVWPFQEALAASTNWARFSHTPPDAHAMQMLEQVSSFAPWLGAKATPNSRGQPPIAAGGPGNGPLIDHLLEGSEGSCTRIRIAGPFFDDALEFIHELQRRAGSPAMDIAIDPETAVVQLPKELPTNWCLRNASRWGRSNKESANYLHAKIVSLEFADGAAVLASGSANPSAPAWVRSGKQANAELVAIYRNESARNAINHLGLDQIDQLPMLSDNDRLVIESNQAALRHNLKQDDRHAAPVIIGYLHGRTLRVARKPLRAAGVVRLSSNGMKPIAWDDSDNADSETSEIELRGIDASRLGLITGTDTTGAPRLSIIPHQPHHLDQRARTLVQRRLSNALSGFNSNVEDIDVLLRCVENVVFDDERGSSRTPRSSRRSPEAVASDGAPGLSVDIEVPDQSARGPSAQVQSDLVYVIDVLISDLKGLGLDLREQDAFGRSEEEQVGTDDDGERSSAPTHIRPIDERILDACQRRLGVLFRRLSAQLSDGCDDGERLPSLMSRCLAVLAIARHLAKEGPSAAWNPKAQPLVTRSHFEALKAGVFGALLSQGKVNDRLEQAVSAGMRESDAQRLKELMLWLAWEARLDLMISAPFNESQSGRKKRLSTNSALLALSEAYRQTPEGVMEAASLFVQNSAAATAWLERIQHLAAIDVETLAASYEPDDEPTPGDIAIVGSPGSKTLRIISSGDSRNVYVLEPGAGERPFRRARVGVKAACELVAGW